MFFANFTKGETFCNSLFTVLRLTFNPLYTGGLFHHYMLVESICHFRGVRFILLLLFYPVSKQCKP